MPRSRYGVICAVLTALLSASAPAASAAMSRDWRVYRLIDHADRASARPPWRFDVTDIAVLSRGGFIFASGDYGVVYRLTPRARIVRYAGSTHARRRGDGGRATSAKLQEASAVAPLPDGGALIADQADGRIRRVSRAGIITTVAGGGSEAPRDGVAATAAALHPDDVLALPQGGFLFDDQASLRIFRVRPDGRLETFAGNGTFPSSDQPSGDGGPSTAAAIAGVRGLALGGDAGVFFSDLRGVRRVGPDGQLSTRSSTPASDLTVAIDGSLVNARANLPVVPPIGPEFDLLGSAAGAGGFFAGTGDPARFISAGVPTTVAATPDGGLLFASPDSAYGLHPAIFFAAPPTTSRLAVAIARATLPVSSRRIVRYRVTRRAIVRLVVSGRGETTTVTQFAHAGLNSVRLPQRLPDGLYIASIRARAGGQGAVARYPVLLGGTLPLTVARAAAPAAGHSSDPNPYAVDGGAATEDFLHRCTRMRARRVDCQLGTGDTYDGETTTCDRVVAVTLGRDGVARARAYRCRSDTEPGFTRDPAAWIGPPVQAPRLDWIYDSIH